MDYEPRYLKTPGALFRAMEAFGIIMDGKARPDGNGKLQLRFSLQDDIVVSISVVPGDAKAMWENAHSHHGLDEVYTVYQGTMVLVSRLDGEDKFVTLSPGRSYMVNAGIKHNVFVFPDTISVAAKLGESVPNWSKKGDDWWPANELDHRSKQLTTAEAVLAAAGLYTL